LVSYNAELSKVTDGMGKVEALAASEREAAANEFARLRSEIQDRHEMLLRSDARLQLNSLLLSSLTQLALAQNVEIKSLLLEKQKLGELQLRWNEIVVSESHSRQKADNLQRAVNTILESRSWICTSPVRNASGLIRRLAARAGVMSFSLLKRIAWSKQARKSVCFLSTRPKLRRLIWRTGSWLGIERRMVEVYSRHLSLLSFETAGPSNTRSMTSEIEQLSPAQKIWISQFRQP
jgi:hypothetical protein